ncbi:MAG: hypothetical protein AB7G93_13380 [Bdellovibrionales bacterium]
MKIEGLGEQRRAVIRQVCRVVTDVPEFSADQFRRMVDSFEKEDVTTFQILKAAVSEADLNYTHYLNSRILGVSAKYSGLGKGLSEISDGESVLGKVMSELRERVRNEGEYRSQFLAPQIQQVSGRFDQELTRVQTDENKRQREVAKAQMRSDRKRSYGLDF